MHIHIPPPPPHTHTHTSTREVFSHCLTIQLENQSVGMHTSLPPPLPSFNTHTHTHTHTHSEEKGIFPLPHCQAIRLENLSLHPPTHPHPHPHTEWTEGYFPVARQSDWRTCHHTHLPTHIHTHTQSEQKGTFPLPGNPTREPVTTPTYPPTSTPTHRVNRRVLSCCQAIRLENLLAHPPTHPHPHPHPHTEWTEGYFPVARRSDWRTNGTTNTATWRWSPPWGGRTPRSPSSWAWTAPPPPPPPPHRPRPHPPPPCPGLLLQCPSREEGLPWQPSVWCCPSGWGWKCASTVTGEWRAGW